MKKITDILENGALSRRNVLISAGTAGLALAIPGAALAKTFGKSSDSADVDILNFALNLEYLEGEFYSYATSGVGLNPALFTGVGNQGPTTGGRKVNFANYKLRKVAEEIAANELAHVTLLRNALGNLAVAKPTLKLDALGIGFAGPTEFLVLSRAFEDTGVSAYGGAARYITNPDYLEVAARILAVEAYHAGNIRFQIAKATSGFATDSMDVPPTLSHFFPTDANALAIIRNTDQVLAIVRGPNASGGNFFPNGLNGNIR